jgi:putative endonuclease
MWYVYVLLCADHSLYCGITTNLQKRLKQHNGEIKGGAKYTRGRGPHRIVYIKKAMNRSIASKLEYQFKQLSRKNKIDIINQAFPHQLQALDQTHLLLLQELPLQYQPLQ